MGKTLGQVAFEAYNAAKGGLTYDGKPIPPWESLTDEAGLAVREAWGAAAMAAVKADVGRATTEDLIAIAKGKLASTKCREASLAITKLDEAEMWFARIPLEAPRG